jgi:hypothetical protein
MEYRNKLKMAGSGFFSQSFINTFMCQYSCVKLHNHFYRVIRQRPERPDWLKKPLTAMQNQNLSRTMPNKCRADTQVRPYMDKT